MDLINKIFRLNGKVQHYAWGGFNYIPSLLSITNENNKPFAEYWLGAHPSAPSDLIIDEHSRLSLHDAIQKDPVSILGKKVLTDFGELPYLFKVLDVNDMLSIQVHPTRQEAIKGFEAEEAAGISINAADRNYKDKNHKPEVMVALSDFWLLHGFMSGEKLSKILLETPEFNFLLPVFKEGSYYDLYKVVMELPQQDVDKILAPLVERELSHSNNDMQQPGYWVAKHFVANEPLNNIDRGIFSIYFFNIVHLQAGEAIFQGAGVPHAYLFGQNVELMANSDNVLRGGLTPKHVDVPELLKHTKFEGIEPKVLRSEQLAAAETNFACPVNDFGISCIRLLQGEEYTSEATSSEILIVINGAVENDLIPGSIKKGESIIVFASTKYNLRAIEEALLYKAFVP